MMLCSRLEADAVLSSLPASVGALVSLVCPPSSRLIDIEPGAALPCVAFADFKGPKLLLEVDDVDVPLDTPGQPSTKHIETFFAFTDELPRLSDASLLVHCLAGVSRAPAFGFALLCRLWGRGTERDALAATIGARPRACPNELIVSAADRVLYREGAMVEALRVWRARRHEGCAP